MTDTEYRGELGGHPFWYDEGGNYVRIAPSDDGGVRFWATDYGFEYGPRLGTEEARAIAAHLTALCDEIDRIKTGPGLLPDGFKQLLAWSEKQAKNGTDDTDQTQQ